MIPWYEKNFGREYLSLYAHRDLAEARRDIDAMVRLINPIKDKPLLDLGCGAGRHLVALRESGFESLVGLDLSQELLDKASEGLGKNVQLIRADMREIPFSSYFLTVLSLFTTFGYFDSDLENESVLKAVVDSLKSGGQFLMDYLNSTRVARDLVPEDVRVVDGKQVTHKRSISSNGHRVEKRTMVENSDGSRTEYNESVRLYLAGEVTDMLQSAGFENIQCYGSLKGEPFDENAGRLIIAAKKR